MTGTHLTNNLEGVVSTDSPSAKLTRKHINNAANALEWGSSWEQFAKFMYANRNLWQEITHSSAYKPLHDALKESDLAIVPMVAAYIKERGLETINAVGPTIEVAQSLLDELVASNTKATYRVIDVNPESVQATCAQLERHLGSPSAYNITLEGVVGDFLYVKPQGTSCVIIDGGTIMNDRRFWVAGRKLAQEGGLLVASAAVSKEDDDETAKYWLNMYDTPQGRELFKAALKQALPHLFNKECEGKWDIAFEYVHKDYSGSPVHFERTPRISVQIQIKEPFTLNIPDPEGSAEIAEIYIRKTRTFAEQKQWDNWESEWRTQFDSNPDNAAKIFNYYQTGDYSLLPEECQKTRPIELAESSKRNILEFILALRFKLDHLGGHVVPIVHKSKGGDEYVMAAIFDVKPHNGLFDFKQYGPSHPWPPFYPHDPTLPSFSRGSEQYAHHR